jgi:hypothetical protein
VIHQTADTQNALHYNEQKVKESVATYFHSANTPSLNPFIFDQNHRMQILLKVESGNTRVINKCLHISFNPSKADCLKMDDKTIRSEIEKMMDHMDYGKQPYFFYKHEDLERVHYQIVSIRINCDNGKKIKDSYEQEKMQQFIQGLEQKYDLKQEITQSEYKRNYFTLDATCSDLKAKVEGIFRMLNLSAGIENETMYLDILSAFHLEVKQSGRGEVILVKNNSGKTILNPLRMSDFKERIIVPETVIKPEKDQVKLVEKQVNVGFKELFKKYRFCDLPTATQELKEKSLYLFRSSETGNYKIYSPDNKMVFSNPFLLNKQMARLDYFNLTYEDFYAIIKDYNRELSEKHRFVSEGLIDYAKIPMSDLKNPETVIQVKDLDLQISKEFGRITIGMDDLSKSFIETSIKDYYQYSIQRIIETEQRINQYEFHREYNQNMKSGKQGLTNDLVDKYHALKIDDLYYLNNHPAGIQEVSLNRMELKNWQNGKNFFATSMLDILRVMPW